MWKPPADQVVQDAGWKPPADAVISDQSALPPTGLQKLAGGITSVMQNIDNPGRMLGNTPPAANTMGPQGDSLFNKAGDAVTDYLGRRMNSPIVPALAGTAVSMANPENWLSSEMPGTTPIPGKEAFAESAQGAGRKALGYTKAYLNKQPGNVEKANAVAQTMLDQGVITNPLTHPFSSGTSSMIERNQALSETSGKVMGENIKTISDSGQKAFSAADVNKEIDSQLRPEYTGGAYDTEHAIVDEIKKTVEAHGNGPLDFESAQKLKEKLQDLGKFNQNTDALKANFYRRASGIVRQALDNSVDAAGNAKSLPVVAEEALTGEPHALFAYNDQFLPTDKPVSKYQLFGDPNHPLFTSGKFTRKSQATAEQLKAAGVPITGRTPRSVGKWEPLDDVGVTDPAVASAAADYGVNKDLYGKSAQAEPALRNRNSSEEGNKNIGLTDTIVAGAELAAGNPVKAAVTLGAKRVFERSYHAAKASVSDALAKETFSPLQKQSMTTGAVAGSSGSRQDLHAEFVRRYIKRVK